MKRLVITISILLTLLFTGCQSTSNLESNENPVKEQQVVVFCNDCGEESNSVDKFCSKCGVEAKWVTEKPEKVEEVDQQPEEIETKEPKEEKVKEVNKVQCTNCNEYFPENELIKFCGELVCDTCYNYPKTCEYGFYDICEGCKECGEYLIDVYEPSDYDIYYPEFDTSEIYTCGRCGKTTNAPLGTRGVCPNCY